MSETRWAIIRAPLFPWISLRNELNFGGHPVCIFLVLLFELLSVVNSFATYYKNRSTYNWIIFRCQFDIPIWNDISTNWLFRKNCFDYIKFPLPLINWHQVWGLSSEGIVGVANLLIYIQNVEKWSQHEEEREDKAASRGVEEDAEAVPAEGDVLPRQAGGGAAGPLRRRSAGQGQRQAPHQHQQTVQDSLTLSRPPHIEMPFTCICYLFPFFP